MAGGLYITEFGQPSMGASGAGAGALGQDASAAYQNPASIMMLDESKWMVTGLYLNVSTKFRQESGTTVSGNDGGDAGVDAVGGALFYANPINDKFGFGFSLNSVAGAGLEYDQGFVGRYWAEKVELLTITLTPSLAYRINDQWSVAFSLPVMLGSLDMDVAIPPLLSFGSDGRAEIRGGDDYSVGIGLSTLLEATDRLRFGLAYASENKLDFDSDLRLTLGPGGGIVPSELAVNVEIPFVQTVRFWGSSDIGEHLTVLATLAWEDWSSFDRVLISTDTGSGALERNWDDTWKVAFGIRWRTGGPWTHYTGISFDTDPTRASDRTADMPIDQQWRLSAGTAYARPSGMTIGGAVTYAEYGDARIDNGAAWGTVVGEYSTNRIIFFGLNFGW